MAIYISIVETGTTVTATEDGANITVTETNVTAAVTSVNGLLEVYHDATLTGAGTVTSPLSVVYGTLTDLIPAIDSTYDIGQAGPADPRYWANSYIDRMYVNDSAYLDGATAGQVNLVGNLDVSGHMAVGADGTVSATRTLFINEDYTLAAGENCTFLSVYGALIPDGAANLPNYGIVLLQQPRGSTWSGSAGAYGIYINHWSSNQAGVGSTSFKVVGIQNIGIGGTNTDITVARSVGAQFIACQGTTGSDITVSEYSAALMLLADTAAVYSNPYEYTMYVQEPTSGTKAHQVALAGNGAGAGVFYNMSSAGSASQNYARTYASAASTMALGVDVSGTEYRTLQTTHDGSNAVLNLGTGVTHEFTLRANETNARLELDNASDYWFKSGHIGIGSNVNLLLLGDGKPAASANIRSVHEYTTGQGAGISSIVMARPTSLLSATWTGVGGYAIIRGSNFDTGSIINGLDFLNVTWFQAGGSSSLQMRGINVVGATGVSGLLTANTVYGIRCAGTETSDSVNITTSYGYYGRATTVGTGTIGTEYMMYLEKPSAASTNYQLVLAGTGTGAGIWFGGTGGEHIWSDQAGRTKLDSQLWVTDQMGIGTATDTNYTNGQPSILRPFSLLVEQTSHNVTGIRNIVRHNPSVAATGNSYALEARNVPVGSNWTGFSSLSAVLAANLTTGTTAGGSVNCDLIGVNIVGATAFNAATITAKDVFGIKVRGVARKDVIVATNSYGLYYVATVSSGGTLTNEYGIYVEKPTKGDSGNYQLVLAGTAAGSGIWLGGTSNYGRIFSPASGQLDFAVDNSGETVYLRIDNGAIDLRNHILGGSASNWSGFGTANIPDTTAGYITVEIDGTNKRIPYYNDA